MLSMLCTAGPTCTAATRGPWSGLLRRLACCQTQRPRSTCSRTATTGSLSPLGRPPAWPPLSGRPSAVSVCRVVGLLAWAAGLAVMPPLCWFAYVLSTHPRVALLLCPASLAHPATVGAGTLQARQCPYPHPLCPPLPCPGVLFALEEATSVWSRKLAWRCFLACFCAVFTAAQLHPRMRSGMLSFAGAYSLTNLQARAGAGCGLMWVRGQACVLCAVALIAALPDAQALPCPSPCAVAVAAALPHPGQCGRRPAGQRLQPAQSEGCPTVLRFADCTSACLLCLRVRLLSATPHTFPSAAQGAALAAAPTRPAVAACGGCGCSAGDGRDHHPAARRGWHLPAGALAGPLLRRIVGSGGI